MIFIFCKIKNKINIKISKNIYKKSRFNNMSLIKTCSGI